MYCDTINMMRKLDIDKKITIFSCLIQVFTLESVFLLRYIFSFSASLRTKKYIEWTTTTR